MKIVCVLCSFFHSDEFLSSKMVFHLINWNIDTFIFGELNADANECSISSARKNIPYRNEISKEMETNTPNQIHSKWALKWKAWIEWYTHAHTQTNTTHGEWIAWNGMDWFNVSKECAVNFDWRLLSFICAKKMKTNGVCVTLTTTKPCRIWHFVAYSRRC